MRRSSSWRSCCMEGEGAGLRTCGLEVLVVLLQVSIHQSEQTGRWDD